MGTFKSVKLLHLYIINYFQNNSYNYFPLFLKPARFLAAFPIEPRPPPVINNQISFLQFNKYFKKIIHNLNFM